MGLEEVKALTFDTGGTILDWHTGFSNALAKAGAKYGLQKDWPGLANELRRRSLGLTVNMGEHSPPERNHDESHRMALDDIIAENGLDAFTAEDRRDIWWQTPITFRRGPTSRPCCPSCGRSISARLLPSSVLG